MGRIRRTLQHHLNAVHVWSRIRSFADWLAPRWERWVHPLIYGRRQ